MGRKTFLLPLPTMPIPKPLAVLTSREAGPRDYPRRTLLTSRQLPSTTLPEACDIDYEGHISRSCRPATARKLKKLISAPASTSAPIAPIASIAARDLSSIMGT